MIFQQLVLVATNTDILNDTRLGAIPYNGNLTIQLCASLADATNNWTLDIQLPNGVNPVSNQIVAASNPALGGVLDLRTLTQFTFPATQGGRFVISLTEAGTAICTVRTVLTP